MGPLAVRGTGKIQRGIGGLPLPGLWQGPGEEILSDCETFSPGLMGALL